MSIKPKRGYSRGIHKAKPDLPAVFCQNPGCGAKISRERARDGVKYCDRTCRQEHSEILKRARRPAQILCAFCDKEIDPMRAEPAYWKRFEMHFCDGVCADGYRRDTGFYQEISKKGNEKAAEYRAKHKQVINHQERSEAVSRNNKERPPKAKHFIREGKVWGYDVKFYPHEDGDKYRVSVPEIDEELGILYAKTVKEGLVLVRDRIVELRIQENKGETK